MIKPQPKISIIIPVTRSRCLDKLFKNLDKLICDPKKTEVIFYIDSDDFGITGKIINYQIYSDYDVKYKYSGNKAPTEVRISFRRDRIVEAHNNIKQLISDDSEYILGLEDDTEFPEDSIQRMLPIIMRREVGFIEGVQVGRWGIKIIGAWRVDDINDPKTILSLPFIDVEDSKNTYLEKIDAGGFYCFMTKTFLYKEANFKWHDDCFGPDVCFGLDLRKRGFINYIDWGLICKHNDHGHILIPDSNVEKVIYKKINNNWEIQNTLKY